MATVLICLRIILISTLNKMIIRVQRQTSNFKFNYNRPLILTIKVNKTITKITSITINQIKTNNLKFSRATHRLTTRTIRCLPNPSPNLRASIKCLLILSIRIRVKVSKALRA